MTYCILHTTIVNDLKTHADTRDLICCISQITDVPHAQYAQYLERSEFLAEVHWLECLHDCYEEN